MSKLRALVIDDEEYICQILQKMLTPLHLEVITSLEAKTALEMAADSQFDLILCDVNLPGMDGITLLKKLKRSQPDAVFIMISGYSSLESAVQATKLGAYDYLSKPFNMSQVHLSVKRGLENRKLLRANKELLNNLRQLNKDLECKVRQRTKELQVAYEKLRELDTLKANFLDLISHEINTPLTLITGYLELMNRDLAHADKGELQKLLGTVLGGAERLTQILEDIQSLTKLEAGKMLTNFQLTDLWEILQHSLRNLEAVARERNLTIMIKKPNLPLFALGDVMRLTQAFQNLLNNAVKYSPDGKTIWVTLKKDGRLWAQVIIEDEGLGIPEALQQQVFQPFYESADPRNHATEGNNSLRGSLGLGLPISQRIIQSHGGDISLTSGGANKGSKFIVRLPLVQKSRRVVH